MGKENPVKEKTFYLPLAYTPASLGSKGMVTSMLYRLKKKSTAVVNAENFFFLALSVSLLGVYFSQ